MIYANGEFSERQFRGQVKKWGFKKNSTMKERSKIMENMHAAGLIEVSKYGALRLDPAFVGTVKVDQKKLNRWRKRYHPSLISEKGSADPNQSDLQLEHRGIFCLLLISLVLTNILLRACPRC